MAARKPTSPRCSTRASGRTTAGGVHAPQREADRVNEPAWPSWYVPGTSLLGEIQSGPDPDDPSGYQRRRYQDEL